MVLARSVRAVANPDQLTQPSPSRRPTFETESAALDILVTGITARTPLVYSAGSRARQEGIMNKLLDLVV